MRARGRVQLLSWSHSIINKENIVMLKQAVASLCRLHVPYQTKAHSALTGWLPIVSGLVWSAITANTQIIYLYHNQFVWPSGVKYIISDMFCLQKCATSTHSVWFTYLCTFPAVVSKKKESPNLCISLTLTLCNQAAVAIEMFKSVPAPRGARRGRCPQLQPHFPEKQRYFLQVS